MSRWRLNIDILIDSRPKTCRRKRRRVEETVFHSISIGKMSRSILVNRVSRGVRVKVVTPVTIIVVGQTVVVDDQVVFSLDSQLKFVFARVNQLLCFLQSHVVQRTTVNLQEDISLLQTCFFVNEILATDFLDVDLAAQDDAKVILLLVLTERYFDDITGGRHEGLPLDQQIDLTSTLSQNLNSHRVVYVFQGNTIG